MSRRLLLTALLFILLVFTTLAAARPGVLALPSAQSPLAPPPPPTRDDAPIVIDGNTATPTPNLASANAPLPATSTPLPAVPNVPASLLPEFIAEQYPAPGQVIHKQPPIYIVFAQPMEQASVEDALSVQPPLDYTLRWKENVLFVDLQQPLIQDHAYNFTLAATSRTVDGTSLAQNAVWTYYAGAPALTVDPPLNDNTALRLRFDVPLNQRDVEQSLRILPQTWSGVQEFIQIVDYAWSDDGLALTVTLGSPLALGETYTVDLYGADNAPLYDAGDLAVFLPRGTTITVPSPVVNVSPPRGSYTPPRSAITVSFDRAIDKASLEAAFAITPTVAGNFAFAGNEVTFTPDAPLTPGESYTATISTDALDGDSDALLAQPYQWTFFTDQPQPLASFGSGANAQVLDADGRRALQFQLFNGYQQNAASTPNIPIVLSFDLYALDREQFLDRYASGFRGVAGNENAPIATDDLPLLQSWQMEAPGFGPDDYARIAETQIPDDVPPGFYVLDLDDGSGEFASTDQLILLLTRHVVMLKQIEGEIAAWVTDINAEAAAGVAGATVGIYARDGELLAEGVTDADGLFRTDVPVDPQPLIVLADVETGDALDVTATGLSNEWSAGGGGWWGWWQPAPTVRDHSTHLYTDRPIYQPGQTVHFKAIVRGDDDAILQTLKPGTPVTARIRDGRDNIVQSFALETSDFGTVHGDFTIAEGAMLGEYAVELSFSDETPASGNLDPWMRQQFNELNPLRQPFKVEEYAKPDYSIVVSTDAQRYVAGDTISVTVDAEYLFGEPLNDAALTVNRFTLYPERWGNDGEPSSFYWSGGFAPDTTRITESDVAGRYAFALPAGSGDSGYGYGWQTSQRRELVGIEVTAADGSGQSVSSFAVVEVYSAAEQITLAMSDYAQPVNEPLLADVQITTLAGEPVKGRGMMVEVEPWWGYHQYGEYEEFKATHVAHPITDADGRAEISMVLEQPGSYRVRITSEDARGHQMSVERWVYLVGEDESWYTQPSDQSLLQLAADRERYAPGDTAQILVESSFSGPALLTVERGSLRRTQTVSLTAPLTTLELPIEATDAPNVFVSINAYEAQDTTPNDQMYQSVPDSALRVNTVELSVPVTDKMLDVEIVPSQETYQPREEATFTIRVRDAAGKPARAELSAALVDEAIFLLSDDLSGSIFDDFYAPRDHSVRTFDGLALRRWLGGGLGGGGGGTASGNPRRDFPDTALWLPSIETDENGEATLTLDLPDTLTSWRLTVKAVTAAETEVGETYTNIETQQAVVVQPLLPRGLTAGDSATLSAVVHNYSDEPQTLDVWLHDLDAVLSIDDAVTQTITLDAQATQVVRWPLVASEAGDFDILVAAQTPPFEGENDGGLRDAVQQTLSVRPLAVADVTTQVGSFTDTLETEISLPADTLAESTVSVTLNRSIAGSLLEGLDYLTGYPYGCVEQTMSRALPNAVVGRALEQLGVVDPTLQADLPVLINAGLQRLYGFQHNDGGWGWWYDDSTDAYQTAWVLFGLSVTREAGYEVDAGVIERGAAWLAQELARNPSDKRLDPRTRAFALYSLALADTESSAKTTQGHLDAAQSLTQRDDLDAFSQAALALTLHRLGDAEGARAIVDALAETATVENGEAWWPIAESDDYYDHKTMASATRSSALALSAFVQIAPDHPLEPQIVRWLMGQRRQQGWGNTNETAFAIIALTDHLVAQQADALSSDYRLLLNGDELATGTLDRNEPVATLDIPADALVTGDNALIVEQTSGDGPLYYVIHQRTLLGEAEIEAAGAVEVQRRYLDGAGEEVTAIAVGELVDVELTVSVPDTSFYVIIEDALPGGLEALNERLNTTSHVADADQENFYWRGLGYNHKEIRDGRVSFFVTELAPGQRVLTYKARATHVGEFVAMPAEAYAMYDEATWGRSASGVLRVE